MIIDELISSALERAGDRTIKDARVGMEYTGVLLEDKSCGLAYTFKDERDYNAVLSSAEKLTGLSVETIIPWAEDKNKFKAALGLAAINAVLNVADSSAQYYAGNIISALELNENDTFGMIGEFHPVLNRISPMTKNIYVFELSPEKGKCFYPPEDMPLYLPKCNYVLITASAIINHTIEGVLALCGGSNIKEVYLVGPSSPLCPEVFGKHNVTTIAGSIVREPDLIMPVISLCGGTRFIKPAVEQVIIRL
jgi:uncharacterized protein (DUF4213/DUF364 family)